MAEKSRITLPGGSEAERFGAPADTRRIPATIVETAFAALDASLAEAVEAIDRLDSPVSDDLAHADILAEDLRALEDVLAAAARVTAHVLCRDKLGETRASIWMRFYVTVSETVSS